MPIDSITNQLTYYSYLKNKANQICIGIMTSYDAYGGPLNTAFWSIVVSKYSNNKHVPLAWYIQYIGMLRSKADLSMGQLPFQITFPRESIQRSFLELQLTVSEVLYRVRSYIECYRYRFFYKSFRI